MLRDLVQSSADHDRILGEIKPAEQEACARVQFDDEREHVDVEGGDLAPPKTVDVAAPVPFAACLGEAHREGVRIRRQSANFRDKLHEPGVQAAAAKTKLDPVGAGTKIAALAEGLLEQGEAAQQDRNAEGP